MSAIGRSAKNLEPPRPLKARQVPPQQVYEVQSIDELIQLTENVASTMAGGTNDPEAMSILLHNLRIHGPQLEALSKDTLDRAFVTFRNASQDERLNIMTRLNLLELIELRAKSWHNSDGSKTYYKHKASHVEPETNQAGTDMLGTSPPTTAMAAAAAAAQSLASLGPNDIIRNSGKFTKPTKIPGKNYSKDEIVIRNADSGKVNPGAKERLVQIAGPSEEKINYAKQLIEETIRRNASPVRLDSSAGGGNGSCSSLASSTSSGGNVKPPLTRVASTPAVLAHSFSTNDASVGEYKYTVSVGNYDLKITGDCCELVRVAKLVLDDYFSGQEFLGAADAVPITPLSDSKLNPFAAPVVPLAHQLIGGGAKQSPCADSGIGLNLLNAGGDADDEVFIVESDPSAPVSSTPNNLTRSRRSNFTRSPEGNGNASGEPAAEKIRILYEYERLVHYSKSPHATALPAEWTKICLKAPSVVRNKVNEEGVKILEEAYSWREKRDTNNNHNHLATNQSNPQTVKFQRNLSFDDHPKSPNLNWNRKSFDAKRKPLVHSKSACD